MHYEDQRRQYGWCSFMSLLRHGSHLNPHTTLESSASTLTPHLNSQQRQSLVHVLLRRYHQVRYRSIITSLLHASPRVSPRVVRVEGPKIYRGKVHFHVTGRGFSTQRLVAFHDTWHFHETSRGISTRPVTVESRVEYSRDQ